MRVLVAGIGSIGARHLLNLRSLLPSSEITAWRLTPAQSHILPPGADHVVGSFDDALLHRPDIAIVAGPATTHIPVAAKLASAGIHLFLEKPLSDSLTGVDDLAKRITRENLVAMVGYNLRFHKPLMIARDAILNGEIGRPMFFRSEVGQYLPEWRRDKNYRSTVSAQAKLGGGAVLELSHELDYAIWLFGQPTSVTARISRMSELEIDVEDTVEAIATFPHKVVGSVHLDFVQRPATRTCHIVGTEGSLRWDYLASTIQLYRNCSNTWVDLYRAKDDRDPNEMYMEEMKVFLRCVAQKCEPSPNLIDGVHALQFALAIKEASAVQKEVQLCL